MAEFLLSACRLALFGVTFLGACAYLRRKTRAVWPFVPLLAVCCISVLMYAAGLLNFMPWMTAALVIFGVYQAFRQALAELKSRRTGGGRR